MRFLDELFAGEAAVFRSRFRGEFSGSVEAFKAGFGGVKHAFPREELARAIA